MKSAGYTHSIVGLGRLWVRDKMVRVGSAREAGSDRPCGCKATVRSSSASTFLYEPGWCDRGPSH